MGTSTAVDLITDGITDVGTGLVVILTASVGLIVAIYLFRKGVKWLKHAGH